MTTAEPTRPTLADVVGELRPSQWTKNLVVFAAFIFALGDERQPVTVADFWLAAAAATIFCIVSSGIYVVNDILDRELDREHPQKRLRPIAAGKIPLAMAWWLGGALLVGGIAAAFALRTPLGVVIAAYAAMQLVYCLWLKQLALLDILVIALGFVLRAYAGGAVLAGVDISPWLLMCTLWLALFLALCKRRHEKVELHASAAAHRPSLVQYDQALLDQLISIVSSGAIVSYALYTQWPDTVEKFGTTALGLTIPFVIFGMFRYLDLVYRQAKGGRPERILLTDIPIIVDVTLYGLSVLLIFHFTE